MIFNINEMDEQPVPRDDQAPLSPAFWGFRFSGGRTFGSVRVAIGNREWCTQCGEMIFADSMPCVVTREFEQKSLRLHFHRACYMVWERMEPLPKAAMANKVVALPAPKSTCRKETED